MKSTKIAARRVIQAGATFAALGALSIATALPAAADADVVGWAYATAGEGGLGEASTYVTPKGESSSESNAFSGALDDYLVIDASTSARVDANGSTSTVTVNSAKIQLTADDIDKILEGIEETPEPSPEPSPSETPDEDADGDETDGGAEDGNTDGGAGDGTGEGGNEGGGDTDPSTGEGETGTTEPSPSPSAPETDETDEADEVTAETATVELTEEDTELTANGDEIVFQATVSGASVSTTYGWNGQPSYGFNKGNISVDVNTVGGDIAVVNDQGADTSVELGYDWDDAFNALLLDITIPATDEQAGLTGGYALGLTYASYGVASDNGGDNGNGGDKGDGDDKKPEQGRDTDNLTKPQPKPAEALPTTGSPIGGLIAAGAAIAAGGGAAAYLARRKKTAVEAPAEENDN
ncbi:cell wall protein [Nocardiopsis protaetiae]|uniref:cell wall protein n=1 Tax=Nocardiopsis protaetiae TaxID=3382270 RepID=UPI00387B4574